MTIEKVMGILNHEYPNFMLGIRRTQEVGTILEIIRLVSEKVGYNIKLYNLSHRTGNPTWIAADRNIELNGLLCHIEDNPEILLIYEL